MGRTPGVRSAAAANVLPRDHAIRTAPFTIEGIATEAGEEPSAITTTITPGYLESLGVGTAAGRQLSTTDRGDSRPVVVVNRAFVAEFLSEVPDVLGTRLKLGIAAPGESESLVAHEIVGVVDDFYQLRLNPGDGPSPQVFVPLEQAPAPAMTLVIYTEGDPLTFAGTVREAIWKVSPEQTIGQVATLAGHIDEMTKGPQTITRIIAGLSALALGLAALGLYGVLSYSVSMRRREIGVRMALGASRRSVVGLVAGQGLRLILFGALFALPGVWAVLKVLTSAFDGVAVLDLAGASLTVGLLFAVGLISCLLPARLAARIPPTETLR